MNLQPLIALDQFLNTLIRDFAGGPRGWADETISSRCWRLSRPQALPEQPAARATWERRRRIVDWLALKLFRDADHCQQAFESELLRRQQPVELRVFSAP